MDYGTRSLCRQVCKRWKAEIEGLIGVSVNIDDREKGLLEFAQNAIVKKASIIHLSYTAKEWTDLRLPDVQILSFSGYINPDFIAQNFLAQPHWGHLRKLYFQGTCLMQQDFKEGHPATPLLLPNLEKLHLSLPTYTVKDVTEFFGMGIMFGKFILPDNSERSHHRQLMSERVFGNVNYLLNSFRCTRLKSFLASIGSPDFFDMDLEPLCKFVELHATTLEQIIVPNLTYEQMEEYDEDDNVLLGPAKPERRLQLAPQHLTSLFVSKIVDRDPTKCFWKDLVLAQGNLKYLSLGFSEIRAEGFNELLSSIVTKNFTTLKYFRLQGHETVKSEETLELDFGLFSICQVLKVLAISTRGRNAVVPYPTVKREREMQCGGLRIVSVPEFPSTFRGKNLNHLPTSLKVFSTSLCTLEDFDGASFMKDMVNLEELRLDCIQRKGFLSRNEQVTEFIHSALRHRRISSFQIEFIFNETIPPYPGGNWNEIRPLTVRDADEYFAEEFSTMKPLKDKLWIVQKLCIQQQVLYSRTNPFSSCLQDRKCTMMTDASYDRYYRYYFDVPINSITDFATTEPFDIEHELVGSYKYAFALKDEPGSCDTCLSTPYCLSPCEVDYHTILSRCGGGDRTRTLSTVMAKEELILDRKKSLNPNNVECFDYDGFEKAKPESESIESKEDEGTGDNELLLEKEDTEAKASNMDSFDPVEREGDEEVSELAKADLDLVLECQGTLSDSNEEVETADSNETSGSSSAVESAVESGAGSVTGPEGQNQTDEEAEAEDVSLEEQEGEIDEIPAFWEVNEQNPRIEIFTSLPPFYFTSSTREIMIAKPSSSPNSG
jgi:hypothetical protein